MKNIYEVMRQKEQEMERLKKELQALHIVAPLLADDVSETKLSPKDAVQPLPSASQTSVPVDAGALAAKPVWP